MKNISQVPRRAFTLLELVFVIIILGIVSAIGADIIAQVYKSYIIQRAQYRATMKTELALTQIANRLRYAIPGTVGFRSNKTGSFKNITEPTTGSDTVLQWVGYDGDSFEAISSASDRLPGWSGVCDVDAYVTTPNTSLPTPGSNLDLAKEIVANLGGNFENAVIYFPDGSSYGISSSSTGETITLDNPIPSGSHVYERYKLAWSSYALVVENNDLVLYYNFSPTYGAAIGGSSSVLLHNVTNFRFKGSEGALRVKLCKEEPVGTGNVSVHACKEKVIF